MLEIFRSATALQVPGKALQKPEVTCRNFGTDSNAQFIAWYAAPMLAAVTLLRRRASLVAASFALAAAAPAAGESYAMFNACGASYCASTEPYAISAGGAATGFTISCSSSGNCVWSGFLRDSGGTITRFFVEGSHGTRPVGINRRGSIVGSYTGSHGYVEGFLRKPNGKIVGLDTFFNASDPAAINDHGVITGNYEYYGSHIGFIRAVDGTLTSFQVKTGYDTTPAGINDHGDVAGYFAGLHGFVRIADGTITTFDVAGAKRDQPEGRDCGILRERRRDGRRL